MASKFQNERSSNERSLTPVTGVPPAKEQPPPDPNMNNPRLLLNRACIYERQLPGDAYVTAHVERLQHGYYSNPAVSDQDSAHVDFLAIAFTFHSPNTLSHRFKSAKIRVSVRGTREHSNSHHHPYGHPPGNPRFLMHAPHLIYGTVSPETMEWTFSLAGSLGVSEMPVSASVIPSGSINSRYRRYEMMRIQGSARTLKSDRGPSFDIETGEIVWSLEENDLQRSGLPREFTFVMLIHKPAADSRVTLSMDIDPVIAAKMGKFPSAMLKLPGFQPLPRRSINFRQEIGQRFEPSGPRGYNFAELASMFDEYIAMPGRKFSRQGDGQPQYQPQPQPYAQPQPQPQPQPPGINIPSMEHDNSMTLNLHLHIDSATASQFSHLARAKSPVQTRGPGLRRSQAREFPRDQGQSPDTMGEASDRPRGVTLEETREQEADEDERRLARLQRAGGSLREPVTSDGEGESRHPGRFDYARARRSIMSMANSPLSGSLLSALSEG
ncbi:unnamed protein product [Penicillium olsonii]|uniref:Uncharacterized protein n=1 Tax=Penicillium olsonii TaxID=99116 RepID=A0A9W4MRB2_PENOL|nr:unnamed protein product [Penicillium olsonii]CAG8142379.1 unnamed protein product [Penicillium olsonii]